MLFLLDVGPCAKAPKKCDIFEHTIAKMCTSGTCSPFLFNFVQGLHRCTDVCECVPTICSALLLPVYTPPDLSLLSVAWKPFPWGGKESKRRPWDVILVLMLPFVMLSFSLFLPSKRAWLLMGPALEASCRFALADHVMFQQTNARPLRGEGKKLSPLAHIPSSSSSCPPFPTFIISFI